MALLPLSVIYWIIFLVVLLKGIIDVFSKSKIKKEAGIKQLIAAVVMLIVGVGVCGYLLLYAMLPARLQKSKYCKTELI